MKRAADLDRKAAVLGRKLVKGLETDDDEDDYYDVSDMEFSGIVFTPVKRYFSESTLTQKGLSSMFLASLTLHHIAI